MRGRMCGQRHRSLLRCSPRKRHSRCNYRTLLECRCAVDCGPTRHCRCPCWFHCPPSHLHHSTCTTDTSAITYTLHSYSRQIRILPPPVAFTETGPPSTMRPPYAV